MRSVLFAILNASFFAILASPSGAQTYPNKPIRLVTPYAAGGGADAVARTVGRRLSDLLGQPVVIDNKPGAGATIGADIVAKAAPDGYTLLLADTSHAITASVYKKLPYDALKDFAPVAQLVTGANILVVNPSVPASSASELIAYAKANPGKLNYGSAGNGSPGHLAMELFKSLAAVEITHIPYKGAALATTDLLGGQIQIMSGGMSAALPHVRAGKLKALAVTSAKRSSLLPDLPTIAESGLPAYAVSTWFGLLAPARTPPAIVRQLNGAVAQVMKAPDVKEFMSFSALEPAWNPPQEFEAQLRAEMEKWRKVVRIARLHVD